MVKKQLQIDSTNGGNGDIWMRLVSFYSIAALLPGVQISILIPKFIRRLADYTFGDRLTILTNSDENVKLSYSSLGLRDLVKGFMKGNRYILPYQRSVIHDKKQRGLKDGLNVMLFNIANSLGLVHIPAWEWIENYQGYLDIIGIKSLKKVGYNEFVTQLQADAGEIYLRLSGNIPASPELVIPADLHEKTVVFPTGTSRQFIPVWWAKKYLPDAYYAFFFKDREAQEFEKAGLKTVYFYGEPGDIVVLSKKANWTISTDSFPSHLLQYASKNCTITITEVLKSRIISPVFKGKVVDAQAKCHPCLHLDRKNHPTCAAGFAECINWKSMVYTEDLLNTLPAQRNLVSLNSRYVP